MGQHAKIKGTTEAWESGQLGQDEEHVTAVEIDETEINEALELQMISIRLQKSLIEDFKLIAKFNGIGYQTLMRQILKRFADSEIKRLLKSCALKEEEERNEEIKEELGRKRA